jgi:hypothetical protein
MFEHNPLRPNRETEGVYDNVAPIVRNDQGPPPILPKASEVILAAA